MFRAAAVAVSMVMWAALALPATAVAGDEEYVDVVQSQLDAVKDFAERKGYEGTHNEHIDRLGQGASDDYTFQLQEGRDYLIVSVCDQDCSDLDLTLYDENNNEIATDTSTDDAPVVEVSPRWSGKFRLNVTMYACSNAPCYYGISVMGK
ncbi:MAG: hypothetical protein E6Q42_05380 [Dechloromonas sp.]|nr:hypothetical protein [Xanthomonadales bacterium]TXI77280.1 MAG: hypothetical protein E6Q42_05380 [Dechloromonas sp.]HRD73457.1 hypothetical protein [Aquimonas sp.]HRF53319.1 hypothetical protein [Aquimonas sp.]